MKTTSEKPGIFYGYIVVSAAIFIMTIAWGTNRTFGVFLKPMLTEFGWSRAGISGAFTMAMFTMGFASLLAGRITDRAGPRLVVVGCGLSLGIGYLLCSRIHAAWQFYIFYGLMTGAGMAVTAPLMSLVARWFVKRRALMASITIAGPAFGNMAMPLIFSLVIDRVGWRISFVIMAGIVLVGTFAAARFVRRDPSEMGLLPYGFDEVNTDRTIYQTEGVPLSGAIRTRQFWLLSFISFCDLFLFNSVTVHIVIHAMDMGISATKAASVISVASGVCIFGRVIIGSCGDRYGCKPTFMVCIIMAMVGFMLLIVAKSLWMLYLFAGIFGFGLWSSGGLVPPLIAKLFGLKSHGAIYGSIFISGATGGALGPVIVGYLFDVTGSYVPAFVVCLIISSLSLSALILLKPVRECCIDKKDCLSVF
jgi:MFS transporter, OFA family, oxalate/formate antiporter